MWWKQKFIQETLRNIARINLIYDVYFTEIAEKLKLDIPWVMSRHVFVSFSRFLTFMICANQLYGIAIYYIVLYLFVSLDAELRFHFHQNIVYKIAITVPSAISMDSSAYFLPSRNFRRIRYVVTFNLVITYASLYNKSLPNKKLI